MPLRRPAGDVFVETVPAPEIPLINLPGSIPAGFLFAGADEALDAVRAEVASEGALMHQVMQVSKGLAEGKTQLVAVEGPPKQDRQQLHRGLRQLAGDENFPATPPLIRLTSTDPP